MKRLFAVLGIVVMVLSLGVCSVGAQGKLIGYTVPDTAEPFLSQLTNDVKALFAKDGIEVQIANAAGDAANQISQIENFAAMGADLIIVMAVDPTSVGDVIQRAQRAGSKVMVAGSDTGAYDAIMYIDQYEDGKLIAQLAVNWINEMFPNTPAGSIKTAIFESRDTPEASDRSNGMAEISKMHPAVDVVRVVGGIKNIEEAQAATENLFITNPDVQLILTYNSGGALGVNSVVMRPGSPVKDRSQFAVFCSDLDPQSLQAVKDSATGQSVLRGLVKFGGDDLAHDTYVLASKIVNGEPFEALNPDPLTMITPENADQF